MYHSQEQKFMGKLVLNEVFIDHTSRHAAWLKHPRRVQTSLSGGEGGGSKSVKRMAAAR